ncbi:MAG: serine/threonine-protein kinase [Gammaproteobacteria bacterium]|nr:serine/threonine-protein kinase [Gammaproteobacteria bacterium]
MSQDTQVNSQTLPVGYQLEDFRIEAVLGQGGFGITYKATEETLRRQVAIKEYLPQQFAFRDGSGQVHPRTADDETMFRWGLNRFLDEARALALFRHPNIVSVMRFFEGNGTAYLVMEFEEGMDFKHWLESRGQPDEERLVHGILAPLLDGLARVHDKGLLHRDIKPDNIFIRRDGSPVLIDFGASRPHGGAAESKLTSIISAGYSPFEQYGSGEQQGPWSDLYALAGTMYRAIAGRAPTDAIARQQQTELTPAVEVGRGSYSPGLLKAIDRALAEDIGDRPQSAREFLTLLGIEPPPEAADPDATFVRTEPSRIPARKRRRSILLPTLLLAAAALTGAGVYWWSEWPIGGGQGTGSATEPQADAADRNTAAPAVAAPAADEPGAEPSPGDGSAEPASTEDAMGEETVAEDPPLNEDRILAGLDVPQSVRSYRGDQLAGAMLAFTQIKVRFDECRESGCAELPDLLARLRNTMEAQTWRRGGVQGSITINNPRRLDSESCPFMLDIIEEITSNGTSREQVRTYCTSNGFDRVLQAAEAVS